VKFQKVQYLVVVDTGTKKIFLSTSDRVKFLYKFVPGVAPQSFGIYVAKMAGINVRVDVFDFNYRIGYWK